MTDHTCPNCAPGYDCERGIYTPRPAGGSDETIGELHDQLGPGDSAVIDGWRITRWETP